MFPSASPQQQSMNGLAVASTNIRESSPTEFTGSVTNTTGILVYKFAPKYPGEYRVSAEVRTTGGANTAQLVASFANRALSTTYLDSQVASNALNWTIPLGTTITGVVSGPTISKVVLNSSSSSTYTTVTGTLSVIERMPIYFLLSANSTEVCFLRNLTISYDVMR